MQVPAAFAQGKSSSLYRLCNGFFCFFTEKLRQELDVIEMDFTLPSSAERPFLLLERGPTTRLGCIVTISTPSFFARSLPSCSAADCKQITDKAQEKDACSAYEAILCRIQGVMRIGRSFASEKQNLSKARREAGQGGVRPSADAWNPMKPSSNWKGMMRY